MLLFRLYSCTFVNVYAVNGMSFTLWGKKKQKCAFWCVYIHHSFPHEYNVYSFIWSSVILNKSFYGFTIWHDFCFLICYGKGLPRFVLWAVRSSVNSLFWLVTVKKNNNHALYAGCFQSSTTMETSQDMTELFLYRRVLYFGTATTL